MEVLQGLLQFLRDLVFLLDTGLYSRNRNCHRLLRHLLRLSGECRARNCHGNKETSSGECLGM